jgi:hypothetical protein
MQLFRDVVRPLRGVDPAAPVFVCQGWVLGAEACLLVD